MLDRRALDVISDRVYILSFASMQVDVMAEGGYSARH